MTCPGDCSPGERDEPQSQLGKGVRLGPPLISIGSGGTRRSPQAAIASHRFNDG